MTRPSATASSSVTDHTSATVNTLPDNDYLSLGVCIDPDKRS